MAITRPTNSQGDEVLFMPEETTIPDTQPTDLSILFNQIWSSIAHQHNNGSTTAPDYLSHGGVWSRPTTDGLESLVRVSVDGVLQDMPVFVSDGIGTSSPFGYVLQTITTQSINDYVSGGVFRYADSTLNRPTSISTGTLLVFRGKVATGQNPPITQVVFGDNGNVAVRYRDTTALTWGEWTSPSGGEDVSDDLEILAQNITALENSVSSLEAQATAKWETLNRVEAYQTNTVTPFIASTETAFADIAAALAAILA